MSVHVGEIHTDLSGARPHGGEATGGGEPGAKYPGAHEDEWRMARDEVQRLRHRVCAEDFDD
jgi:hypothetical protein